MPLYFNFKYVTRITKQLGWKGSLEIIWSHSLLKVGLASELEQHAQGLHSQFFFVEIPQPFWEIIPEMTAPMMKNIFLIVNRNLLHRVTIASHASFCSFEKSQILSFP